MKYTFGTSAIAASRLEEIAKFFNPLAKELIKCHVTIRPKAAVDLGCGPGFTTNMLQHATKANQVYGLDKSGEFLSLARDRFRDYTFIEHDITKTPFPVRADVMYVRFLLSHLIDPITVINKWITQVNDNGILVVEELEDIKTDVDLFKIYLSTNAALIASQGAQLYIGNELSSGIYDADVLRNDCAILPVMNCQAAKWFLPNTLTIWRNEELVKSRFTHLEIQKISDSLSGMIELQDNCSDITWNMRRIVLEKRGK